MQNASSDAMGNGSMSKTEVASEKKNRRHPGPNIMPVVVRLFQDA